jgi:hypothetical protein
MGHIHLDVLCRHWRVRSRLAFLKNGRHDRSSITIPTLSGTFRCSLTHSAYKQHARREHIFIVDSLHRTSDYARQLDAYALPLDGTPTYANISDAVRLLPSITACSIAVPHGLTVNDR